MQKDNFFYEFYMLQLLLQIGFVVNGHLLFLFRSHHDRMVVVFTTTCAISAYHH